MIGLFGEKVPEEAVFVPPTKSTAVKYTLKDFFDDISNKNGNLLDVDPEAIKYLNVFILNRALAQFRENAHLCHDMNQRPDIDKEFYYNYMYNNVRRQRRQMKFSKVTEDEDLELVKRLYTYSNSKAIIALDILKKKNVFQQIKEEYNR